MSIRYNRQYKRDVDIEGPIGPDTNEDQTNLSFLNNNDTYLGGGSGGTYYSAPINPPIDDLIYTPGFEVPIVDVIEPTPENPTPNEQIIPYVNYEIAISSNLQNEIFKSTLLDKQIIENVFTKIQLKNNFNYFIFSREEYKSHNFDFLSISRCVNKISNYNEPKI